MNGRMCDPIVGRFLSPDPYVQAPDFSQGYNRYSYCLNNPLKYSDPTGEKWWHWALGIADFLGGGVLSAAALITAHNVSSMALITAHNVSSLGIGLAGFASTIPVTPGIISGTAAVAGVSGFTLAGAVGGVGIGNGLANSFLVWIGSGFNINGDFYNGKGTGKRFGNAWKLSWGMFKTDKDLNFFQRYWQFMSRYTYEMPVTAFGQAFHGFANAFSKGDVTVDYFHGATVLQAEWMGSGGVTLGSNITIGYRGGAGGTYGGIDADNPTLLHEYGHYLQTRRYGNMSWYNMAFSSLTTPSSMTHMDNWTERDANYRAARYFQNKITPDQYNNFLTEYTGYFNSYGYRLGLGYLMPFEIFTNLFWR